MSRLAALWRDRRLGWVLLAPHALSAACFAGGLALVAAFDTNRLEADLRFGIAGFAALAVAVVASLLAAAQAVARRLGWLRPLAHLAALAVAAAMAGLWIALHLV